MSRHRLKLLVLLMAFCVAPASAGQRVAAASAGHRIATPPAGHHDSDCPYERARQAAWAAQNEGPTTITLTDRVPPDGSLLGMGHGSGFLSP